MAEKKKRSLCPVCGLLKAGSDIAYFHGYLHGIYDGGIMGGRRKGRMILGKFCEKHILIFNMVSMPPNLNKKKGKKNG